MVTGIKRRRFLQATATAALAPATASAMQAPALRRLLGGGWPVPRVAGALLPPREWRPYPLLTERAAWDAIPSALRQAAVTRAQSIAGSPWPSLPATLFLEYRRSGNRSRYEAVRSDRRNRIRHLAVAECVENKGRFLDELVNGLWLTAEETYWGVPAHVGVQKAGVDLPDAAEPTVDLFAADTGSLLAWVHYLFGARLDEVSPLIRPRLEREVKRRILDPCYSRIDFWWMGLDPGLQRAMNNWNPWINSNWLTCALLMEQPERRAAAVHKIISSIDRFLDSYHDDGGCDEGPGYWGHAAGSLSECLELLRSASAGKMDFFNLPLVAEMGRYIYRAHIAGQWFVNFADASARIQLQGPLVYRYGRRVGDERLMATGAWATSLEPDAAAAGSIARQLDAMLSMEEISTAAKQPPLVRDVWLPQTQFFAARVREGATRGLYIAAQGGHNAESHNHNDVGNFVVYADGKPALIDIGVETYTAQTFSARRYEIWTMQSAWHNLPTINGQMQAAGRRYEARECTHSTSDEGARLSMDIAQAWPHEAGVERWKRTFSLDRRTGAIALTDEWTLRGSPQRIEFSLITTSVAQRAGAGVLVLSGGLLGEIKVRLEFDAALRVEVDEHDASDARLRPVWGDVIRRIRLVWPDAPLQGSASLRIVMA